MPRLEDHNRAAIFDFDGIIFNAEASWKIVNPKIGTVGTPISGDKGYAMLEEIRHEQPDVLVSEYFTLDDFAYEKVMDVSRENVLPISRLMHIARYHMLRQDVIYLMTPVGFDSLLLAKTELAFQKIQELRLKENPFKQSRRIYPPRKYLPRTLNAENRRVVKTIFLSSYLKYKRVHMEDQRRKAADFENEVGDFYNKIFYYHTEPGIDAVIQQTVSEDLERLVDGRNSIISMYMVEMEKEF